MQGLSQKLKRFQLVFKDLNLEVYSNIGATKENARIELQGIQTMCIASPFDADLLAQEKVLMAQFMEYSAPEESFKKQKSRVRRLPLGDQNK